MNKLPVCKNPKETYKGMYNLVGCKIKKENRLKIISFF